MSDFCQNSKLLAEERSIGVGRKGFGLGVLAKKKDGCYEKRLKRDTFSRKNFLRKLSLLIKC